MTRREGRYPPQRVVPYDPAWPERYARLRDRLRVGLDPSPGAAPASGWLIEHVGSTSVPGCLGKPVIDVAVGVPDGVLVEDAHRRLAELGWQDWVRVSDHWVTYLLADGVRSAIAHVYTADQWATADLRVFAAWLRAHPADRDAYAARKLSLVEAGVWGLAYTAGKAPLVQELTDRAHGTS